MKRRSILAGLLAIAALPAHAAPERYLLDQANSIVAFGYSVGGQDARGTMPVSNAEIFLDFDSPARSTVSARLNPDRASAGLFLATQAMKGPDVLHTDRFPTIDFRSTRVIPQGESALIEGDITIRGVTRPITLDARIYRQRGTEAGTREKLSIHLRGRISRQAFGAVGFADLVGDTITLDILTRIDRAR